MGAQELRPRRRACRSRRRRRRRKRRRRRIKTWGEGGERKGGAARGPESAHDFAEVRDLNENARIQAPVLLVFPDMGSLRGHQAGGREEEKEEEEEEKEEEGNEGNREE